MKIKVFNKIILSTGFLLIILSFTLEPYENYDLFYKKYMEIGESDSENKNKQYTELRNSHLTKKYDYFDYGMTLVILALFLFLIRGKDSFQKKNSKVKSLFLGLLALILFIISIYFHLFLDYSRGSNPHWADSIGIPLFYIEGTLKYIILFFLLNFLLLLKKSRQQESIKKYIVNNIIFSFWSIIQILIIFLLLVLTIYYGLFFMTLALLVYLLFFSSLFLKSKYEIQ